MAKIYSKNSINKLQNLEPKKETILSILNYSKVLNVVTCNKMTFETILN